MPRWLARLVCWAQGHNLVGMTMPPGRSWQECRTCGKWIEVVDR